MRCLPRTLSGAALALGFAACASPAGFAPPRAVALGFDQEAAGTLPGGWKVASTHPAKAHASWGVQQDASAPSAPNVLALVRTNHDSQETFNLCWTDQVTFQVGAIDVRVRADGGEVDQGGGVAWRVLGPDDYYLCRYNPLEANFRVYLVTGGERRQLASALVPGAGQGWHTLHVEHTDGRVVCTLDGGARLDVHDDTQPHLGGVGLWTKADARTSFDDLKVTPWKSR